MTDLHCHILPGIDDGAKNAEVSLELLHREIQDGVKNIALTSHFNSERITVEQFLQMRRAAYDTLQAALESQPLDIRLKLGAEVYFSPKLCDLELEKLCMEGTAYVLIELPTTHRPHFIRETFSNLQARGMIPIVAHVERYPYVLENPQLLYQWVAAGAYAQINATSLLKGGKTAKQLLQFIKWDLVHVVATDTHSLDKRPPRLGEAMDYIAHKLGTDTAEMLKQNSDALFNDQELDCSDPHMPKKFLGMWV